MAQTPIASAAHMYQPGASGEPVTSVSHATTKDAVPPNTVMATA